MKREVGWNVWLRKQKTPSWIRRALLSWLLAATLEWLLLPHRLRTLAALDALAEMSFARVAAVTGCLLLLLTVLLRFGNTEKAERWGIVFAFGNLAILSLRASFSWAFLAACGLLLAILVQFGRKGWEDGTKMRAGAGKESRACLWISVGMAAAFFLFVSAWTVGRVYSFCTPTYDFGIFSQMFYNMKESGAPMTTVERDGWLSHFAVHVSPIFYLLLPFYCLFPTPAALQVLQAAVITSAAIPLWKLGKHHGLTGVQRMLLCAVLFLYPAFSGGTSYDIHENCFLTPLLLWLFYGIDRENIPITAFAAVLCLCVKEDAAVYVAVIALWLIVRTSLHPKTGGRRALVTGIVLLSGSLGWFFAVTGYLARMGDGVMTYRYGNFLYDGSGSLAAVVKAVLMCPMKAVYECVDGEKLRFLAMTLVPLLGLPLLTRRYERYILLIPYILVNLMPDYPYQHSIFFQYTFGSFSCLLYLTLVNLADLKTARRRIGCAAAAVAVSAVCFCTAVVPTAVYYPVEAIRHFADYQAVRDVLAEIPEDASVTATTFYTTCLSQRETLYDVRYSSTAHMLETEYVVLDVSAEDDFRKYASDSGNDGYENFVKLLEENGYTPFREIENVLLIYRKTPG